MTTPLECPCGGASPGRRESNKPPRFDACCGPFIDGSAFPSNAMQLMRSRYTAYVLQDTPYLRATWSPETCPPDLDASDAETRWLGLDIKRHLQIDANHEEVEFVARFKVGGRAHRLHESSRFTRDSNGHWIYIDGKMINK